ncbi:MAG: DEAD/DEAH box helicase family protein, partial [Eubacterium sp.]|nr:DEAD/DEAH box helicase family protein [Eubacterium sp.]
MTNLAEQIIAGAHTGFIDSTYESEELLRPKLLYNNTYKGNTVLAHIEHELKNCDSFWFSVAFVTKSGLIVIKEILKELEKRHPQVRGRILTTDYLSFNEPGALRELLKFSNLEVRVVTEENFHTKGYMFKEGEKKTFIVGSSNLTQNALKSNKEWNLKVTSLERGELILETNLEFESMWERAMILTEEWIETEYEPRFKEQRKAAKVNKVARLKSYTLKPNLMQREATKSLENLRAMGERKALLVSATGTGKTYLSAFDVRNFSPKKMLFLVHREQILKQAEDSFKDVLGNGINTGLLTGNHHDSDADYLFSTVQTMSKDETLKSFARDYFDYIIIDETHKAGAKSYQKIIDYFNPKFMLGMTASPERTDGYDI